MERTRIDKERTWIYSPVNNIVIKVDIKGSLLEEQLKKAIRETVDHYDMLHQKIVVDQEGNAYYQKAEIFEPVIKTMECSWEEVAKEQEHDPIAIDQGEFIRFFYQKTAKGMTILIIAHHIAGDGISFTYLVQDILRVINGEKIENKKLELYNMDKLPSQARLRASLTWLIKMMNKKWKKTGRTFDFSDYYEMHTTYWNNRETSIYTYYLENENYDSICRYAKEKQLTINSLITTALIRASGELCDVGMAASIREKGFTGMGNYATGISIKYQYQEKNSFEENARKVQEMIYDKLNDSAKRFFLLQFMKSIEPTLIDAIYFNACSNYENKTAEAFSKMFGYSGNPKGISITNLTRIPIEDTYGDYEITDFVFVPPLVLNARRIIGIASFGTKMAVSLHLNKDASEEENRRFFYKGMEYLKNLS
jgi:Uncharacterized protein containing a NRPS condensation (elongation) domain